MICCNHNPRHWLDHLIMLIKKGESLGFVYQLKINKIPMDLTGAKVLLQIRETPIDNQIYLIEKEISEVSQPDIVGQIIDAKNGMIMFKINKEDIQDFSTAKGYFPSVFLIFDDFRKCISADYGSQGKMRVFNG